MKACSTPTFCTQVCTKNPVNHIQTTTCLPTRQFMFAYHTNTIANHSTKTVNKQYQRLKISLDKRSRHYKEKKVRNLIKRIQNICHLCAVVLPLTDKCSFGHLKHYLYCPCAQCKHLFQSAKPCGLNAIDIKADEKGLRLWSYHSLI